MHIALFYIEMGADGHQMGVDLSEFFDLKIGQIIIVG